MKLSDYVIDFLAKKGVTHVFGMSGGAVVHLFDSAARHPGITPIFNTHEQASAMAADGYSRVSGKLGVAMATSGPGVTNLITGCACSYYDSIPTLMLVGQVATNRLKGDLKVRQFGFQETDTEALFAPVTKYAKQLTEPKYIRYVLEKAYHMAFEGRPGPVLISIPDDLQRADINPEKLVSFPRQPVGSCEAEPVRVVLDTVRAAKRPIMILGQGLKTPECSGLDELIFKLQVPILATWAGLDRIEYGHPQYLGTFGVYGSRLGNWAIQHADLILCLGTRLSQNLTGAALKTFAPQAKLIMVDVDGAEMFKFDGRGIDVSGRLKAKLSDFIEKMLHLVSPFEKDNLSWVQELKNAGESLPTDHRVSFFEQLSKYLPSDEQIFVDTGANLTWACNNLHIKKGQQLHSAWNFTPMGYALPAAIGAAFHKRKPVTCIIGDGGLLVCLAELATVIRHSLPIRIFLVNNGGHAIQRQTISTWLEGHQVGTDRASGLALPNFREIAEAMGFVSHKYDTVIWDRTLFMMLRNVYTGVPKPEFIDVHFDPSQGLTPFLKSGDALDRQRPYVKELLG